MIQLINILIVTLKFKNLPANEYNIVIQYYGDYTYNKATNTTKIIVNKINTDLFTKENVVKIRPNNYLSFQLAKIID